MTIGWIMEAAEDRRAEASSDMWPYYSSRQYQHYTCPLCGKVFLSVSALEEHQTRENYGLTHPLEAPEIYIMGEKLLDESVVRKQIEESELEILNSDECAVSRDGAPEKKCSVKELERILRECRESSLSVRLFHFRSFDGAILEKSYRISFRIPESELLDSVDRLFVRHLVKDGIQGKDIDRYQYELPKKALTDEYACALGDYAVGILLKDSPRSILTEVVDYNEFVAKMRSALEVLRHFERRIPLAVTACIRFNLNDFSRGAPEAIPELFESMRFFNDTIMGRIPNEGYFNTYRPEGTFELPVCPVDRTTQEILDALRLCHTSDISLSNKENIVRRIAQGDSRTSEYDLLKIRVILAYSFLRANSFKSAEPLLRKIRFDPFFGEWAQKAMEAMSEE